MAAGDWAQPMYYTNTVSTSIPYTITSGGSVYPSYPAGGGSGGLGRVMYRDNQGNVYAAPPGYTFNQRGELEDIVSPARPASKETALQRLDTRVGATCERARKALAAI